VSVHNIRYRYANVKHTSNIAQHISVPCLESTDFNDQIKKNLMGGTLARTGRRKVGKREEKRPMGRPRRRWEGNIKIDIKEIGLEGLDWILLARNRDKEQAFLNTVMKFPVT